MLTLKDYCNQNPDKSYLLTEFDDAKNGVTPDGIGHASNKNMWWNCPKGHSYQAAPNDRFRYNYGCPYCCNHRALPGFNDLATTDPEIAAEWDYGKNEKGPDAYTRGSGSRVWWKCAKGHEWQSKVYNRVQGHNCPVCSNKKVLAGYNDLATVKPGLAGEWDYGKNEKGPEAYTRGSSKKVWWKCAKGHSWRSTIANRSILGHQCPYCQKKRILGKEYPAKD